MSDGARRSPERRFRIPLLPFGAVLVIAAVAVNMPVSWFTTQTPEARRAEVFSEFVVLSGSREAPSFAFLETVAALSGQDRKLRQERIARVHPSVLRAYAALAGVDEALLRDAMLAKGVAHPFDLSDFVMQDPQFDRHGQSGAWHWGLAQSGTENLAPEAAKLRWCAQWLVIWNASDWYYAPVGTNDLAALVMEIKGFEMPMVETCDADA